MKSLIFALLSTLILAGCVNTQVTEEHKQNIRKVAVVSFVAHDLDAAFIGTTIFSNERFRADVSEWQLDKYITRKTINALRNKGIEANALQLPANYLDAYRLSEDGPLGLTLKPRFDFHAMIPDINQKAEQQGFDHLLLIKEMAHDNMPHYERGLNLLQRKAFGMGMDKAEPFALASFNLWKTTKPEMIARTSTYLMSSNAMVKNKNVPTSRGYPWKSQWNRYSYVEKEAIKKDFQIQLDYFIEHAVNDKFKL